LAARLPASIAEEVADGLTETYESCLSHGLAPSAAAEAAVAEFGPAEEITAGFTSLNPARHAARRLLRIGPAVGACWVAALLASRTGRSLTAWTAPGPAWVMADHGGGHRGQLGPDRPHRPHAAPGPSPVIPVRPEIPP
jgi:hypothetical protein